MSTFASLLAACGLSQREAAEFLGVRYDSVRDWATGRCASPSGVIDEMHRLVSRQLRAAREAADIVVRAPAGLEEVEVGVPSDDHESQSLGWPTKSAWMAMAGMMMGMMQKDLADRVVFVPRGSTPPSAAAADIHGQ